MAKICIDHFISIALPDRAWLGSLGTSAFSTAGNKSFRTIFFKLKYTDKDYNITKDNIMSTGHKVWLVD